MASTRLQDHFNQIKRGLAAIGDIISKQGNNLTLGQSVKQIKALVHELERALSNKKGKNGR